MEIPIEANNWLTNGERGISSEAIFSYLTGINVVGHWGMMTPSDPADLRRCLLLLEAVPQFRKRFKKMKRASEKWEKAVEHWNDLRSLFEAEAPNWRVPNSIWAAPKTYHRMKQIGL